MNVTPVPCCPCKIRLCALLVLLVAGCDSAPKPQPPAKAGGGQRAADQPDKQGKPTGTSASEPGKATDPKAPAGPAVGDGAAKFVDVAAAAGLDRVLFCGGAAKNHILESVGSGCAWFDYDEDGWQDIYLVNAWQLSDSPAAVKQKGRSALYRNLGNGKFADVTDQAGVGSDEWGCGVCAGDYDNDGHVDLYVTNFGRNRLYRNRGDGNFVECADAAGVAASGWSSGAAFFDADGDGWLDLYVARYIDCTMEEVFTAERTNTWRDTAKVMVGPFGMRGGKDLFFHNNHDGTFSDTTEEVGMADVAESYGLGVLASDLDNDGDLDLYVANDSNTNFLYRNDGGGKFTDIGGWCGAGLTFEGRPQAGMGVDAGDFDGDGLQDIVVTNFSQDYTTIYKNDGQLFFRDISLAQRMKDFTYNQVKWGCALFDYDLDGRLDLLILNGHIYPQVDDFATLRESYKQLPTLLHNIGGKYADVSRTAGPGLQIAESMRGLALADYDHDGRLDALITAIDAKPLLLHDESPRVGHYSEVRVLNKHGSPAIGALVQLTVNGVTQLREVRSGSTYCSQSSFDLHFGLGNATKIDTLKIRWPDGKTQELHDLPADKSLTYRQGE